MNRNFLFMSGEHKASLPAVISMDNWMHSCTPERLLKFKRGCLKRDVYVNDVIKGVILFADVDDKSIEEHNIDLVISENIPCWPNPRSLKRMFDRHDVIRECKNSGFLNHNIIQFNYECALYADWYTNNPMRSKPFVLKTGNKHRGEGKHRVESINALPEYDGLATIEPYFNGDSIRVLVIGDDAFGIKVENETSWIKNTTGAEISKYDASKELIDHAMNVTRFFGLDVCGVDYIVNKNGFHLLEPNYAPGLAGFDDITQCAISFLKKKMGEIEECVNDQE